MVRDNGIPEWMFTPVVDAGSVARLPSWSTMLTRHGVLFTGLTMVEDYWYGWAGYVANPPMEVPENHFAGRRWLKILSMPWSKHHAILDVVAPGMVESRRGKLARVHPSEVTHAISARDPATLAAQHVIIEKIADALNVSTDELGLCGSFLYKNGSQSDVDFVVYGTDASQCAWRSVQRLTNSNNTCWINGRRYHIRFRLPDVPQWCDPHFFAREPYTTAVATGNYQFLDVAPIHHARVLRDDHGMYMPARYLLDDDSLLVSYRLGHAGLLRCGDRISAPSLPVVSMDVGIVRLVLCSEPLAIIQ